MPEENMTEQEIQAVFEEMGLRGDSGHAVPIQPSAPSVPPAPAGPPVYFPLSADSLSLENTA